MNTEIELMYRDACNWKSFLTIVVEGVLRLEDIQAYLHDGEFLIPGDLGLPELELDDPNPDIDHPWYEVAGIHPTGEPPTIQMTAEELLTRFRTAKWDEMAAMERIGLI